MALHCSVIRYSFSLLHGSKFHQFCLRDKTKNAFCPYPPFVQLGDSLHFYPQRSRVATSSHIGYKQYRGINRILDGSTQHFTHFKTERHNTDSVLNYGALITQRHVYTLLKRGICLLISHSFVRQSIHPSTDSFVVTLYTPIWSMTLPARHAGPRRPRLSNSGLVTPSADCDTSRKLPMLSPFM